MGLDSLLQEMRFLEVCLVVSMVVVVKSAPSPKTFLVETKDAADDGDDYHNVAQFGGWGGGHNVAQFGRDYSKGKGKGKRDYHNVAQFGGDSGEHNVAQFGRDYHNVAQFGGSRGGHNVAQFGRDYNDAPENDESNSSSSSAA